MVNTHINLKNKGQKVGRDKKWYNIQNLYKSVVNSAGKKQAVAKFRLVTGHDCLLHHLARFSTLTLIFALSAIQQDVMDNVYYSANIETE